jgi:uncharacterized protein (DUF58 family)
MNAPAQNALRDSAQPLIYALRWRVSGVIPGAHPGSDSGQSGHFRQIVPFDRSPDPRRIDLRSTVRDPFGLLYVRQFEQRAAARVEMLVDMSASMAFGLRTSNFSLAAQLVDAISKAAHAIHDSFGLALCGEKVELFRRSSRGNPAELVRMVGSMKPRGRNAHALIEASRALVGRRRLVFLVSDFAYSLDELAAILDALAAHDVVPLQVAEDVERALPRWGLLELADLETGRRRFMMLRPSLRARWLQQAADRRAKIAALCATRGRRPFVLKGRFDAFALADYLLGA